MAIKKKTQPRHASRSKDHIPVPHHSWRLAPAATSFGGVPVASASEFWSRLGL
jgi:hypothetical protein